MEKISPTTIIELNPKQLGEVRKLYNYDDVSKLIQDIDILQEWIRKQNHFTVREFDKKYLERFLITNKGSVERAKKRFDKLCTLRNLMPEFSKNYDVRNEFIPLLKCLHVCVLPKPNKDYTRVAVVTVYNDNFEDMEIIDYYRYLVTIIEYLLQHDYNTGYEFVADLRNIRLTQVISKLNPIVVHKAMTLLEGYGLRIKGMHFISESKYIDAVVTIAKHGLSEKVRNRFQVHASYESLHKFIPRDILPIDLDGEEKSIKELSEIVYKELCSDDHIETMKFMETVEVDESCRVSGAFNAEYSGLPGSFKTLCVD